MKKMQWTSVFFTLAMIMAGLFLAALAVAQDKDAKKKATATITTAKNNTAVKPHDASLGVAPGKQAVTTVQPYKDPEDMTTRAKDVNAQTPSQSASGTATDAKKHPDVVKYQARQAGNSQTLDGGSKDAAKSATRPENGQGSKRVNKVDSFTVKQ